MGASAVTAATGVALVDVDGTKYSFELEPGEARQLRVAIDGGVAFPIRSVFWVPVGQGEYGELRDERGHLGLFTAGEAGRLRELTCLGKPPGGADAPKGLAVDAATAKRPDALTAVAPKIGRTAANLTHIVPALHDGRPLPRMTTLRTLWESSHSNEEPLRVFQHLHIRPTGGLDRDALAQLWRTPQVKASRSLSALSGMLFAVANPALILYTDLEVLRYLGQTSHEDRVTIMGMAFRQIGSQVRGEEAVMIIEMTIIVAIAAVCAQCIFEACFARQEQTRWHSASRLYLMWLPRLASFNGMRLLAQVNPFVVLLQISLELGYLQDRVKENYQIAGIKRFLFYLLTLVLCLIVGMDAFIVKLRVVSLYIGGRELDLDGVGRTLLFLFQVLCITDLGRFAKKRLEVFMFGGADCRVSDQEKGLQFFWNASLVKRLYKQFGCLRCLVIMLSFSDFDFQMLMLQNDEDDEINCKHPCAAPAV